MTDREQRLAIYREAKQWHTQMMRKVLGGVLATTPDGEAVGVDQTLLGWKYIEVGIADLPPFIQRRMVPV